MNIRMSVFGDWIITHNGVVYVSEPQDALDAHGEQLLSVQNGAEIGPFGSLADVEAYLER